MDTEYHAGAASEAESRIDRRFAGAASSLAQSGSATPGESEVIELTEVEAAFKSLKDDFALRPVHHKLEA